MCVCVSVCISLSLSLSLLHTNTNSPSAKHRFWTCLTQTCADRSLAHWVDSRALWLCTWKPRGLLDLSRICPSLWA